MSKNINAAALATVDFVVSVGSVDGVLTSAAVLRHATEGAGLVFTQAFAVDKLDPKAWGEARKVVFVDLAVNNKAPQMTTDFVRKVIAAGHQVVGVCDEHDAEAWKVLFTEVGLDFEALLIKPCSQGVEGSPKSSGTLLLRWLKAVGEVDNHTLYLCLNADEADRMDFSGPYAKMVNEAVKSAIADDSRRVYLARHLATNGEVDSTIQGWIAEYGEILANHQAILTAAEDLGDGIIQVSTLGKKVDITVLMSELYKLGRIAIVVGEVFNPATKTKSVMHAFGVKTGDILSAIKAAGINAGGFASKANVAPEDVEAALVAARAWVKTQS